MKVNCYRFSWRSGKLTFLVSQFFFTQESDHFPSTRFSWVCCALLFCCFARTFVRKCRMRERIPQNFQCHLDASICCVSWLKNCEKHIKTQAEIDWRWFIELSCGTYNWLSFDLIVVFLFSFSSIKIRCEFVRWFLCGKISVIKSKKNNVTWMKREEHKAASFLMTIILTCMWAFDWHWVKINISKRSKSPGWFRKKIPSVK